MLKSLPDKLRSPNSFASRGNGGRCLRFILVALAVSLPIAELGAASPTFNHDVAPIVYKNCSPCHRPGEAAPFSLLSFEDVSKKGKIIAKVTQSHVMPPWKAEPASFEYRDNRLLADHDIAILQEWVGGGMPEGNANEKPTPPHFESGWQLGEPDLIVEMPTGFHIPAEGPDIYRNLPVALGITEDKWISAIDMKPSTRGVVHHVLYFGDPNGRAHLRPSQGGEPGFSGMVAGGATIHLGGWALGAQPHFFPEGLALHLPKNSDLVVQYHFHPTGKPEVEKSLVGLYFAKKAPDRRLTRVMLPPSYSLFSGLDIPAGEKDFVLRDSYTLPVAMDAIGVGAHAHNIASRMKMTATFPDGSVKTLLNITDWDFAWQDRYFFKDFVALPKGTKLDVDIHWDNSSGNVHNLSNPPIRVTWGEESKDEMGAVSVFGVAHEQGDLPTLEESMVARGKELARVKMATDPELRKKVLKMLTQ
jgi:hypothetical protein